MSIHTKTDTIYCDNPQCNHALENLIEIEPAFWSPCCHDSFNCGPISYEELEEIQAERRAADEAIRPRTAATNAAQTMRYYLSLLFDHCDLSWDADNTAEIEYLIDQTIAAAIDEIRPEIEELRAQVAKLTAALNA